MIPFTIVTLLFAIFTPSRNTVLLIAASEMGERAFGSQVVQQTLDPAAEFLQTWMRDQTAQIRRSTEGRR